MAAEDKTAKDWYGLMGDADLEQRLNMRSLNANSYPGRGIVIGRLGETAVVQLYWLMGRDDKTSRNRVLVRDDATVRAERFDKSQPITAEELALIEYNAMRETDGSWLKVGRKANREIGLLGERVDMHVVTNGNQTDTIIDGGPAGRRDVVGALMQRTYEPDGPNFTPRISAVVEVGSAPAEFMISIIRRGVHGETVHQFHKGLVDKIIEVGSGLCVHTYLGNGTPLPAFDRDPYKIRVGVGQLDEAAEAYWSLLNPDNRVSLVGKSIDTQTGEVDYHIINRHETADK